MTNQTTKKPRKGISPRKVMNLEVLYAGRKCQKCNASMSGRPTGEEYSGQREKKRVQISEHHV